MSATNFVMLDGDSYYAYHDGQRLAGSHSSRGQAAAHLKLVKAGKVEATYARTLPLPDLQKPSDPMPVLTAQDYKGRRRVGP